MLRKLFATPAPIVIAGAHDGLSARLVEEAGFDGIWASGFEISASHGVPDASLLTVTEMLDATRGMRAVTKLPIVVDADTGFGNAINAIRTVEAFKAAGAAGLCIEDNVFPKRCSFYAGVKRLLADVDEQQLKIRAAVDAASDDFVIIARTEALIAGWGLDEALRRGRAYADAGADAILIHSNQATADDVAQFADAWDRLTPLVCVPTTYSTATVGELSRIGFKMVIFANHGLRASIKAAQDVFRTIRQEGHASAVDDRIVPLSEVYRLVGLDQLKADERTYLPRDAESVKAVILAAGFDRRLMPLVADKPKALLDVKGKPILERQIDALRESGVQQIAVVRGYKKEQFAPLPNVRYYDNDAFEESGELESLLRAGAELSGTVIVMYGDILFDRNILDRVLESTGDITLVCDRSWPETRGARAGAEADLVVETPTPRRHHRFLADGQPVHVSAIGASLDPDEATAEFIGIAKLSARGCQILGEVYRALRDRDANAAVHEAASLHTAKLTDLLDEVIRRGHPVASVGIYQGWLEVDTFDDYRRAWLEVG